jgi:hypothetical protein
LEVFRSPTDGEVRAQENAIWLSSTFGVALVTGLIGSLLLALTPNVAGDALIAGICLVVISCIFLALGVTFCICKGCDVCECC